MRFSLPRRLMGVATAFALVGVSLPAQAQDFINILTGGTSGVYYPLGVALSKVYTDKIKGSRPSVQGSRRPPGRMTGDVRGGGPAPILTSAEKDH